MKLKVQQRDYLDILRQSKEKGDVISDVDDVNHDVSAKMDISSQSKEEGDVISDVRDVGDVNDVSHDVSAKISARTYAQVTARFVQFQENGKKLDTEKNQNQNIHVRNVNTKTLDTRSDKPLQNVQGIESSLKTQLDEINVMNDNVMNDNELKPTMHPGGISEGVTLTQVLNDKELFE